MREERTIGVLFGRHKNLILYGIIGCFCAGLDFAIYSLLCLFDGVSYLVANVISIHCGIICSFLLNRSFNFKVKDHFGQRLVSFYLVGLVGLGISEGSLFLLIEIFGWNQLYCKLISIVFVAIVQFFLNKYVTFKIITK